MGGSKSLPWPPRSELLIQTLPQGSAVFSFAREVEARLYKYSRQLNLDLARPKGSSWRLLAFANCRGGCF